MIFRDLPIQQKLIRVILTTCSVALFLMAGAYILFEYFTFKQAEKSKVSTLALVIASNSSAALAFQSQSDATEILNALRADKDIVSACLYNTKGQVFAKYPHNAADKAFPAKPLPNGFVFNDDSIEGFQAVRQENLHLGTLYIKSSIKGLYAQIGFNMAVALLLMGVSLFIGYMLSRRIQKAISVPIISLEQTARTISEKGDYSIRAVKSGNDELGSLTDAFNNMLCQIEEQNFEIVKVNQESLKLAAIVESSGDAIIGCLPDHTIISWNRSAERILGFTAEEVIGKPASEIFGNKQLSQSVLDILKSGEQVEALESQFICKDKTVLDISLTISPVKDPEGNIIGVSQIARDITLQKRNERKISDSEEHLRLATRAAELGTFDLDLNAGTMMWDKRCRELFGIYHDREVTYEDDFLKGLHDDDRERIAIIVEEAFDKQKGGGLYDVEYRTIGETDKRLRWIRAKGKVFFDAEDKPVRFIGSVLDITKQKQDEIRKNDFIAIISHELKTPLTTIKSYVQILLGKAKTQADDFAVNALTRADVQTNKMSSMIKDFLELAKIEGGKLKLDKTTINVSELLKEVVLEAKLLGSAHEINLSFCDGLKIHADRDKICQVIINLISNAIKYSQPGTVIDIGCALDESGKVKIFVKDEGVGISLADQKQLFTRFYRVENEKIKTVSGFGVGLFIVSEILKYHGSEIKVDSIEGKGSTFYFAMDEAL